MDERDIRRLLRELVTIDTDRLRVLVFNEDFQELCEHYALLLELENSDGGSEQKSLSAALRRDLEVEIHEYVHGPAAASAVPKERTDENRN